MFWNVVFSVTWLVAFKYHSKSRQLLRIERLTKARVEKINRLKNTGSSGDTVSHRESMLISDDEWVKEVKKKYSVKQNKYRSQKRIGMVLIIILTSIQTYFYNELFY